MKTLLGEANFAKLKKIYIRNFWEIIGESEKLDKNDKTLKNWETAKNVQKPT